MKTADTPTAMQRAAATVACHRTGVLNQISLRRVAMFSFFSLVHWPLRLPIPKRVANLGLRVTLGQNGAGRMAP